MKILAFCPYYPPHIGGLESHADEFNKYLSQKGADIVVFTPRLPQDAPEQETRHKGVRIIRFPAFEIIANYPLPKFWTKKYWGLKKEIKKENFNIVISRTRFFFTSLSAFFYAKIHKKKWIHIEHGSDFVRLSSRLKTAVAKLYDHVFGRMIFRNSDLNVSISKVVRKFVYKFDKRESPVIYRGLDLEDINRIQPDNEAWKKYKGKTIIVFAGRLYKWKGVENSIRAIKSLPDNIKSRIVFLIIGNGEDYNRLKKTSKDEKSVVMLGNMPREKAISILKISDIFIHSSFPGGGLSTSLLEAMYCGCAVIATPNEGADEVVKDGKDGILVGKSNPKLIADKIALLLDNPTAREKMAKGANEKIFESFQWKRSIEKYLVILRKNDR